MRLPSEIVYLLGSVAILIVMFGPIGIYQRLRNMTGTLRGSEHGPKWQFAEYLKRQPVSLQTVHKWIDRLKAANFGVLFGAFVMFIGGASIMASITTMMLAWVIWMTFCFTPHILNGIDAVILRAAIFPHGLWIGKRQFVTGPKAQFGGYFRMLIGILAIVLVVFMTYSFYSFFVSLSNLQGLIR